MVRIFARLLSGLLSLLVLVYVADFTVWRMRLAQGNGTDTIEVSRVSLATLKSNREEYYFDGVDMAPCTRSLLPPPVKDGWGTPCWWLVRHRQKVTRY